MSEQVVRSRPPYVAVIGDGEPHGPDAHRILEWAEEVGQHLARGGAVVVTGGLGGVMRSASRGAAGAGGETIGILPGLESRRCERVRSHADRDRARRRSQPRGGDVGGRGHRDRWASRHALGDRPRASYGPARRGAQLVAGRVRASPRRPAHPPRPRPTRGSRAGPPPRGGGSRRAGLTTHCTQAPADERYSSAGSYGMYRSRRRRRSTAS